MPTPSAALFDLCNEAADAGGHLSIFTPGEDPGVLDAPRCGVSEGLFVHSQHDSLDGLWDDFTLTAKGWALVGRAPPVRTGPVQLIGRAWRSIFGRSVSSPLLD